jgi:hypothetical protein
MTDKQNGLAPFEPGRKKTGGRKKGTRNKLSADFVAELAAAFEERGAEAIQIVITERPHEFLRIIAAILPKEFEINDNRLKDIPDDQLDAFIEFAKRQLSPAIGKPDGGKDKALN